MEAIAAGDGREVMKFDADESSAMSCNIDASVFDSDYIFRLESIIKIAFAVDNLSFLSNDRMS